MNETRMEKWRRRRRCDDRRKRERVAREARVGGGRYSTHWPPARAIPATNLLWAMGAARASVLRQVHRVVAVVQWCLLAGGVLGVQRTACAACPTIPRPIHLRLPSVPFASVAQRRYRRCSLATPRAMTSSRSPPVWRLIYVLATPAIQSPARHKRGETARPRTASRVSESASRLDCGSSSSSQATHMRTRLYNCTCPTALPRCCVLRALLLPPCPCLLVQIKCPCIIRKGLGHAKGS